jgi:hypothetical protein
LIELDTSPGEKPRAPERERERKKQGWVQSLARSRTGWPVVMAMDGWMILIPVVYRTATYSIIIIITA